MKRAFVKPKAGLCLPFEGTRKNIPEEGATVRLSSYYVRRRNEGDLVELTIVDDAAPAEAAPAEPAHAADHESEG